MASAAAIAALARLTFISRCFQTFKNIPKPMMALTTMLDTSSSDASKDLRVD
jgi:hypothetical protein